MSHLKNIVFNEIQLKILLILLLECDHRNGLVPLVKSGYNAQRIARYEYYLGFLPVFGQHLKVFKLAVELLQVQVLPRVDDVAEIHFYLRRIPHSLPCASVWSTVHVLFKPFANWAVNHFLHMVDYFFKDTIMHIGVAYDFEKRLDSSQKVVSVRSYPEYKYIAHALF